jgi:hypothetical protein
VGRPGGSTEEIANVALSRAADDSSLVSKASLSRRSGWRTLARHTTGRAITNRARTSLIS